MKCPYCGGNPVIFDPELQVYVCPHCGSVIEEHPVEYRLPKKETPNVSRDDVRRTRPLYKMDDWLVRLVEDQCRLLGLGKYLCLQVKKRMATVAQRIVRREGLTRPDSRKFRYVSAACIYTILLEHGSAVSLKELSRRLGLKSGKVYTALYRYKDIIGFKPVNKLPHYIPVVIEALKEQLPEEQAEQVREEVEKLATMYPQTPENPLYHVAMLAIIATRRLGFQIEVKRFVASLGFNPSQVESIYTRTKELARKIELFEEAKKTT
jgi:transcription initiation factor TFIIIB Brf1 subunit/transcription initiation factor TFIIB